MAGALHDASVTGDHIHLLVLEELLGGADAGHKLLEADCHSDRAGKSGRQGACGDFDARGVAVLGMAGGLAAKLAELLQILDGDIVSEEVQQRIEEHRAMAGGEHEPVAANPVRTLRVEAEEL